jgi:hypothetical protein
MISPGVRAAAWINTVAPQNLALTMPSCAGEFAPLLCAHGTARTPSPFGRPGRLIAPRQIQSLHSAPRGDIDCRPSLALRHPCRPIYPRHPLPAQGERRGRETMLNQWVGQLTTQRPSMERVRHACIEPNAGDIECPPRWPFAPCALRPLGQVGGRRKIGAARLRRASEGRPINVPAQAGLFFSRPPAMLKAAAAAKN